MILHDKQKEIVRSGARFKVVRAGRKGGKTALEVENICYKAMISAKELKLTKTEFKTGRKVLYIAPTQKQAENIIWSALKSRLVGIGVPNEQKLQMKVPNEDGETSIIYVGGWENRENYRGLADVVHITFDETDTLKDFFISWLEIFRPMFLDTGGTADFIGTPKKENPNMKRLEKDFKEKGESFECFHFTSKDNPHLDPLEIEAMEREYENDRNAYVQEILAEYVDNTTSLFRYSSIVDTFTNSIDKTSDKFLIVDVAGEGEDKTKFSYWEGLEEIFRETYQNLRTEDVIQKIREIATSKQIPYSHIAVDAIGIGEGVASSSLLEGIIGFKSSYSAIRTDTSIISLPNLHYTKDAPLVTDYANLRSQCVFKLAGLINNHKVSSKVAGRDKENIIEELSIYQDVSKGDGKRLATAKEDVKKVLGRSPDDSDTWIMRMYFEIVRTVNPALSPELQIAVENQLNQFRRNRINLVKTSTK